MCAFKSRQLVVVAGPTAVGKTASSIALAKHFNTCIVSADARQVYQGMPIGTAQPTPEERTQVPHYLVDFLPITAAYSAGTFVQDAQRQLEQLWEKHPVVVLTGGSGLYIDALCQGLSELPPSNPRLREQLNQRFLAAGIAPLLEELRQHDPLTAAKIDPQNPRRIIRALEVCLHTGQPYSTYLTPPQPPNFQIIWLGLDRPREELYQRIHQRAEAMVQAGLWEEAAHLLPYREFPALQTIGYPALFDALEGKHSPEVALELLKQHTRRYAKRQLTWWRRNPNIRWFAPTQLQEMIQYIVAARERTQP